MALSSIYDKNIAKEIESRILSMNGCVGLLEFLGFTERGSESKFAHLLDWVKKFHAFENDFSFC